MLNQLPQTGFVRVTQILTAIPIGRTTWWKGVRSGRFPQPIKLSTNTTVWNVEDIHALIKKIAAGEVQS